MAAEDGPIAALQLTTRSGFNVKDQVAVTIDAKIGDKIADGKLTVQYDTDKLTYVSAEVNSTWAEQADTVLSVNNAVPGQVILAFAGTEAAKEGTIITLYFSAQATGTATFTLVGENGNDYITGLNTADGEYTLAAQVSTTIQDSDAQYPSIPVTPDDSGDTTNEKCDGGDNCPSHNFTDVTVDSIYHEGIDFMVKNGYMNGVSATSFAPQMTMNRGMIVTILYRMAGAPAVSSSNPFTDVKSTDYCYDAVRWAVENGITKGVSATEFNPNGLLTRQEIAAFLYRYAELVGYDTSKSGDILVYQDADQVFDWAQDAMKWAVGSEIIKGASATQLKPADNATREQIAVMVWRLVTANQG